MKPIVEKLIFKRKNLEGYSYVRFIAFQLIQYLAIGASMILLFLLYAKISGRELFEAQNYSKPFWFYSATLFGSIIMETFIFQYVPFQLFKLIWKVRGRKSPLSFIIFSALVFGLFHIAASNKDIVLAILKVIGCTFGGIILSTSYYILVRKKQYPFWSVFLIHFLYDFIILGLAFCMKSWI